MADKDSIFSGRVDDPLEKLNTLGTMFNGVDPTTYGDIELDPFTQGYALFYWVKLPFWFEKDGYLKNFKNLTLKSIVSFQGITDTELSEESTKYGFAGNDISFVTGVNRGNTDFSIGFKEYSGTPVTHMFDRWIGMIRDKNTGIALYPELYNCEYSARNHTGVFLYVVMRPDVTNIGHQNIEKAWLWSNVIPLNVPNSTLFNYELGTQSQPDSVEVNFKGVPLEGKAVDDFAAKIIKEEILNVSEDNPSAVVLFPTTTTVAGDKGTELFTTGLLKDIYNSDTK